MGRLRDKFRDLPTRFKQSSAGTSPAPDNPETGFRTTDAVPTDRDHGKKLEKAVAFDTSQIKLEPLPSGIDPNRRIARAQNQLQQATADLEVKLHKYTINHPGMAQKGPLLGPAAATGAPSATKSTDSVSAFDVFVADLVVEQENTEQSLGTKLKNCLQKVYPFAAIALG